MLPRVLAGCAAVFVLTGAVGTARAQLADSIASVSYELFPYSEARTPNSQVALQIFRLRAGFPLVLSKKTILIPGISYEMLDFRMRTLDNGPLPDTLHAPSATFLVVQRFGDRFTGIASIGAGFATDFTDRVSTDDVLFTAMALGLYKFSDSLTLGAGIGYDRRTGSLRPLPAVGVNWQMGDRVRVRGFVPALRNIEYRAVPWLTMGLRGTFEGNRFQLGNGRYGKEDLQLAYSTLGVGPKLTFRLADMLHLDVYASAQVMRRYEVLMDGESAGSSYLPPVVAYGVRLWFGPSGWRGDAPAGGRKTAKQVSVSPSSSALSPAE